MSKGGAILLLQASLWIGAAGAGAQSSFPPPKEALELFSERLNQSAPVLAADPEREFIAVLGHSQDRLALRRVGARDRVSLGPVRAVSTWPLSVHFHKWAAAVEPTRGRTLVVWTEEDFQSGSGRLMAQGFASNGRRVGPSLVVAEYAGYGNLRVVWVPWTGRWLVVWANNAQVNALTVSRGARRVGPTRRLRLRGASRREIGGFDLAVDAGKRRLLLVGAGRPDGLGLSKPARLTAWLLDGRGRTAGREILLGRYERPPQARYDSLRGRFLIAWQAETKVRGVFLEGRRVSDRFALHSGGFVRSPELAFARGTGHFLLTWKVPEVQLDGRGGVFPAIVGRWLDGEGRAVTEPEVIGLLEYQDLRIGYSACVSRKCLVAWEASRGLDAGSFLDRHAIVGRLLTPPG